MRCALESLALEYRRVVDWLQSFHRRRKVKSVQKFSWLMLVATMVLTACDGEKATSTPTAKLTQSRPQPTTTPLAPALHWQEFSSKEGGFSILMPGEPEQERLKQSTLTGDVDYVVFMVERGDSGYMVSFGDMSPQTIAQADTNMALEGAVQGAVNSTNSTLVSKQDITLDGYPGKEFEAQAMISGIEVIFKARIYLVQNRLYQILVVGPKDSLSVADIDKFLYSFKLTQAD
jgi:hypothetical protein